MSQVKTLQQFRDYIKRELGHPINVIEVDDTQLNQIIETSVQEFCRYNYSDASYLEYYVFSAQSGVSTYPMSGESIEGIFDIALSLGVDGINTLFSPTHELLYSDFIRSGTIFGEGGGFGASPGMVLASYDSAMIFLQQIKQTFGKMYTVRWLSGRETMIISPTPTENCLGVLSLYRQETAINLYNHVLLKKLCTARAKKQWGWNLLKYDIDVLPDGAKIRADKIYDEGKEEEKEALISIKGESQPIDFYLA